MESNVVYWVTRICQVIQVISGLVLCWFIFIKVLPHKPRRELAKNEKLLRQIQECGLVHFTDKHAAESILQEQVLRPGRWTWIYPCERDFVWLYPNTKKSFRKVNEIRGQGGKKDSVVVIPNLSEEQLRQCLVRTYDKAIVFKGTLQIGNGVYVMPLEEAVAKIKEEEQNEKGNSFAG